MVASLIPGVLFFVLALALQILAALDYRPPSGDSVLPFIAAGFFWVFLGPLVIVVAGIIGWFAVRGEPRLRDWWLICTMLSIGGWLLMAEFMRLS